MNDRGGTKTLLSLSVPSKDGIIRLSTGGCWVFYLTEKYRKDLSVSRGPFSRRKVTVNVSWVLSNIGSRRTDEVLSFR